MSIDVVANFLTIIRNGIIARKRKVYVPHSAFKEKVIVALKSEGYINDFVVKEIENKKNIEIFLKYYRGESVIHEITRISKPSRRVYEKSKSINSVIGGLGVSLLSTSYGIMADRQARQKGVGGEVICHVW
jgi:small subunit ribosomal protein S8